MVQEKLQHYIDQVEVNIASQVCTKSHHFFQVMTYHNALMSQLSSLIAVVRTVRGRVDSVKEGVEAAIMVPQPAVSFDVFSRTSDLQSQTLTMSGLSEAILIKIRESERDGLEKHRKIAEY